jgi:hypothetical protein
MKVCAAGDLTLSVQTTAPVVTFVATQNQLVIPHEVDVDVSLRLIVTGAFRLAGDVVWVKPALGRLHAGDVAVGVGVGLADGLGAISDGSGGGGVGAPGRVLIW